MALQCTRLARAVVAAATVLSQLGQVRAIFVRDLDATRSCTPHQARDRT